MIKNLDVLKEKAYRNAIKHGWHEEVHSDEHWIVMISTEIAEAIKADRNSRHVDPNYFCSICKSNSLLSDSNFRSLYSTRVADTFEDEIADIVIRILDFAGLNSFSFEGFLLTEDEEQDIVDIHTSNYAGCLFTEIAYRINELLIGVINEADSWEKITHLLSILTLCEATSKINNFDLQAIIEAKMRYNTLRPYKHGFKAY